MAAAIGVSLISWQGYEYGKHEPRRKTLEKIVGLGFNLSWILTGEGFPRVPRAKYDNIPNSKDAYDCLIKEDLGESVENRNKHHGTPEYISSIHELIVDLVEIMESDDEGTKLAIAQNIKMFKESVRRKKRLEQGVQLSDFKEQKR